MLVLKSVNGHLTPHLSQNLADLGNDEALDTSNNRDEEAIVNHEIAKGNITSKIPKTPIFLEIFAQFIIKTLLTKKYLNLGQTNN